MKQMSFATTGFELVTKRTRKREFLHETDCCALLDQEHQPVAGDVCAVKLVDGTQTDFAGSAGMSAPAVRAKAQTQALRGQKRRELERNLMLVSPYEHSGIDSDFGRGYADLP